MPHQKYPILGYFLARAFIDAMSTIHDSRYIKLIETLVAIRVAGKVTQQDLAGLLEKEQSYVAKVENFERRLDVIEFLDWLKALGEDPVKFMVSIGWFVERQQANSSLPALPIPQKVSKHPKGVLQHLAWQNQERTVLLEGITPEQYLHVEKEIARLYAPLNKDSRGTKNREVIAQALELAVDTLPKLNPSDIYHHIVYRLYLREYSKTQADRSWVRAGGESIELFVATRYGTMLHKDGIQVRALVTKAMKLEALRAMGISKEVGGSKLDVALYGTHKGRHEIFGGIHIKASLAERVSDDVPCSVAMMRKGYVSYLFTFDAKSFPPPAGDLVNRGELGSNSNPSDKRKYIEQHGSFNACFSYNLRTVPSPLKTQSGKRIYVSDFSKSDPLAPEIRLAWDRFRKSKLR